MEPAHGLSRMYKCFAPNCKQHAKEWPRQDNFKQHLMRMHKGESVVALLQRSIDWYDTEKRARQAASETESPESGQQPASSNQPYRGSSDNQQSQSYLSPTWRPSSNTTQRQQTNIANRTRHSSFSGQPHASPGNALGSNGNPLLHTTFTTNPLQFSYQSLFDNSHHIQPRRFPSAFTVPNPEVPALSDLPERVFPSCSPSFTTPQNDLAQIASNFPSEQHSDLPSSDHELHSPSGPANETPQCSRRFPFSIDDVHALMNNNAGGQKNKNAAMLELIKAGWEKINESKRPSTAAKTTSSSPSIITSTATTHPDSTDTCVPFRCPETRCNKTFSRPCDLKKHMKRHDRPYGCTFSKCYEKFGSKYDWKRHETYQHFQQECWKCDLCLTNSAARNGKSLATTTSQLFYKRKLYEDHLRHVHSSSPEMILDLVWKQRIGRNCQSRFWCGFCEKIVVLEKKGLEGANERFNHIDDHFKKNRQINEWVEMEGSMAKGDQQGIGREEDEESVEDVLGEDGINSGPNGRGQDTEDDGDDNDNHSAAEPERVASRTGQKRHRSSDFDISPSSDQRSARRQRTINPDPTRKSGSRTRSRAEYMVICHQCENGPVVLQHSERCISCQHDFCGSCTYSCRPKPDE